VPRPVTLRASGHAVILLTMALTQLALMVAMVDHRTVRKWQATVAIRSSRQRRATTPRPSGESSYSHRSRMVDPRRIGA
jgi:hypothetical protein